MQDTSRLATHLAHSLANELLADCSSITTLSVGVNSETDASLAAIHGGLALTTLNENEQKVSSDSEAQSMPS